MLKSFSFEWVLGQLWRRQWHPTPVLLPGKSHGQRVLVGCSPRGRYELDMTEWLHFHFLLSCIGEGNGNPLHCSCLENPRDGEPGGLPSMGSHRVWHDWCDLAAAAAIGQPNMRIYLWKEPGKIGLFSWDIRREGERTLGPIEITFWPSTESFLKRDIIPYIHPQRESSDYSLGLGTGN